MRSWAQEKALGLAKRLRRFALRIGVRREWYELGFFDGWEAANNIMIGVEKELTNMSHKKNAELTKGNGPPEKSGSPKKAAHHEGAAGSGSVSKSKFGKESRDPVGQKEPGKSRGPGG